MERDRHVSILLMEPTGSESGGHEAGAIGVVSVWNWRTQLGKTFSSNAGFTLPLGHCAPGAWIEKGRWRAVPDADRQRFAHISPDFIIEICSPSDRTAEVHARIEEWLEAGVRLAFLIDPIDHRAWSYRPERAPIEVADFLSVLSGEDSLPDLELPFSLFTE